MTLLLENHDNEFFQSVPHLHDATDNFMKQKVKDCINQLGKVFEKHGVEKKFGLIMIHRHFDLETEEVLVETLKEDHSVSVSVPWIVKDGKGAPTDKSLLACHGMDKEEGSCSFVVPQTWAFNDSGELKAYEFLASKELLDLPPAEFVSELFTQLKQLKVEKNLGLRYIHNLVDRTSWKITPHGGRANVLTFGPLPEWFDKNKMFQVVFMFNKGNGNGYCCCYGDDHSWSSCSEYSC